MSLGQLLVITMASVCHNYCGCSIQRIRIILECNYKVIIMSILTRLCLVEFSYDVA